MITRAYIDKNNTIINGSLVNTGKNPITELVYGGTGNNHYYTRFLLHFDISKLISEYNKGNLGNLSNITHTLRLTNTQSFEIDTKGQLIFDDKLRASSFDLVLLPVDMDWDEGIGYDYSCLKLLNPLDCAINVDNESNWSYAKKLIPWNELGVISGDTTSYVIESQHFDNGNENISMNITQVINDMISGGTPNYGFMLAYDYQYESLTGNTDLNYVGFFTRHTQTYFEPFLETNYSEVIRDDRYSFYTGKSNRLYLYSNVGGIPTNLDSGLYVEIHDSDDNLVDTILSSAVTMSHQGVYYVNYSIPTYSSCTILYDVWKSVSVSGITRPDITLEFSPRNGDEYFNIGDTDGTPKNYGFSVSGIKRDERIKRGDVKKVFVSARVPYTINKTEILDRLQYRLYIKEGKGEIDVIDWDNVNMANNHNYFLLDTSWMIPTTYYLDLKYVTNQESIQYTEVVKFQITNQVKY